MGVKRVGDYLLAPVRFSTTTTSYAVYMSTDGVTWTYKNLPAAVTNNVTAMYYHEGTYFLLANSTVHMTTNFVSWTQATASATMNAGVQKVGSKYINPLVTTATTGGIYTSDDLRTWTKVKTVTDFTSTARPLPAANHTDDFIVYESNSALHSSQDGVAWVSTPLSWVMSASNIHLLKWQDHYLVIKGTEAFKTKDLGVTWESAGTLDVPMNFFLDLAALAGVDNPYNFLGCGTTVQQHNFESVGAPVARIENNFQAFMRIK